MAEIDSGAGPGGGFVVAVAETAQLPIAADHVAGVVANLERMREMAEPLMAFSIPDDVESAQVFEP